ncbi:hypothetical protein BCR33DRAFT_845768 [Rhizoclosmatium globosum]|uniref:Uncharacterized protein n=1 Tax=Rhizoclosmatium globosum TaxID=329046 RepID=A0A1Y2D0D9_9FUNG|nr:hypothetical protein BCR33DRAFT_845768 [Rhizoclosmatium globosum]|eukprot:ORY52667.1 hypothetical protein BCR33DRAFT_845768 [Rhizoclosmatium globosum]
MAETNPSPSPTSAPALSASTSMSTSASTSISIDAANTGSPVQQGQRDHIQLNQHTQLNNESEDGSSEDSEDEEEDDDDSDDDDEEDDAVESQLMVAGKRSFSRVQPLREADTAGRAVPRLNKSSSFSRDDDTDTDQWASETESQYTDGGGAHTTDGEGDPREFRGRSSQPIRKLNDSVFSEASTDAEYRSSEYSTSSHGDYMAALEQSSPAGRSSVGNEQKRERRSSAFIPLSAYITPEESMSSASPLRFRSTAEGPPIPTNQVPPTPRRPTAILDSSADYSNAVSSSSIFVPPSTRKPSLFVPQSDTLMSPSIVFVPPSPASSRKPSLFVPASTSIPSSRRPSSLPAQSATASPKNVGIGNFSELQRSMVTMTVLEERDSVPKNPPLRPSNVSHTLASVAPENDTPPMTPVDQSILNLDPKSLLSKNRSRFSALPTITSTLTSPSHPTPPSTSPHSSATPHTPGDNKQLPQTLSDTDPFLLKLIALTTQNTTTPTTASLTSQQPLTIQGHPPPRSTSFHYIPGMGSTPPSSKGSRSPSPNPSSLKDTIHMNPPQHNIPLPDKHQPAPSQHDATPQTLLRVARARTYISARYALLEHQVSTLGVAYNPLAVIRYRREAWQVAVRQKAPMGDVRKVRMLKGGWEVGVEEWRDWVDAGCGGGASVGREKSLRDGGWGGGGVEKLKDSLTRSGGGGGGGGGGKTGVLSGGGVMSGTGSVSVANNDTQAAQEASLFGSAEITVGSPPLTENESSMGRLSLARRRSLSADPNVAPSTSLDNPKQKVLKRFRSGTVALNAMLGKGRKPMGGVAANRRASALLIEERHRESPDGLEMVEESTLLNSLFGGDSTTNNERPPIPTPIPEDPTPSSQSQPRRLAPSASIEDDTAQVRQSRSTNRFINTRNILQSPNNPNRQTIMSTMAGDIERWIGNVLEGNNNGDDANVPDIGGDAGVGDDVVDRKWSGKRKLRLGGAKKRREDEQVGSSVMNPPLLDEFGNAALIDEAGLMALGDVGKKTRRKSRKQREAGEVVGEQSNALFRLPRIKVKVEGALSGAKKMFGTSMLSKEEDVPGDSNSPKEKRKSAKRLIRLSKEKKVPLEELETKSERSLPRSSNGSPLIRRKSSKKIRRKSSMGTLGLDIKDRSGLSDSPDVTSSVAPKDSETSSDIKSELLTTSSKARTVKGLEVQVIDVGNAVSRLLNMVLEMRSIERKELVEKLRPYAELITNFQIILNPKMFNPISLKEMTASADQLHGTLISPKFITHEAQAINLTANHEKLTSTITSLSRALEAGDATIQSMILEMEKLGKDINETGSRRVKELEDHIQHKVALNKGPLHGVMEVLYQFLEAVLIVVGYIIWVVYKGVKFGQQGWEMIVGQAVVGQVIKEVVEGK